MLSNVIVRLGDFHLFMSFVGAIGYVMTGSSLKELFNIIYSTKYLLTMHTKELLKNMGWYI